VKSWYKSAETKTRMVPENGIMVHRVLGCFGCEASCPENAYLFFKMFFFWREAVVGRSKFKVPYCAVLPIRLRGHLGVPGASMHAIHQH
jgi:hypothetical protein